MVWRRTDARVPPRIRAEQLAQLALVLLAAQPLVLGEGALEVLLDLVLRALEALAVLARLERRRQDLRVPQLPLARQALVQPIAPARDAEPDHAALLGRDALARHVQELGVLLGLVRHEGPRRAPLELHAHHVVRQPLRPARLLLFDLGGVAPIVVLLLLLVLLLVLDAEAVLVVGRRAALHGGATLAWRRSARRQCHWPAGLSSAAAPAQT